MNIACRRSFREHANDMISDSRKKTNIPVTPTGVLSSSGALAIPLNERHVTADDSGFLWAGNQSTAAQGVYAGQSLPAFAFAVVLAYLTHPSADLVRTRR